jgi:hypothetical protein
VSYLIDDAAAVSPNQMRRQFNQRYMFALSIYQLVSAMHVLPSMRAADLNARLHHGLNSARTLSLVNLSAALALSLSVLNCARELCVELVEPTPDQFDEDQADEGAALSETDDNNEGNSAF